MNEKLENVMQESKPIEDIPINDSSKPKSSDVSSSSRKQPDGPPDALSSINPAFYNSVIKIFHSIADGFSSIRSRLPGGAPVATQQDDKRVENRQAAINAAMASSPPKRNLKPVGIVIVIVLVIAIGWVGNEAIKTLRGDGVFLGIGNGDEEPTPTLSQIEPEVPSIYAKDEVVLVLEEDINTLDGQLTSTVLKESSLDTPQLDFDVRF